MQAVTKQGSDVVKEIPAAVMELPAQGYGIQGGKIADVLGSQPTLLVFLRHFG